MLDAQAQTADSIRLWARSLAGFTGQLAKNDPQIRTLLENGPGAFNEASRLLDQIKPTLPVLLANLTTIGQIGVTYHASLEQVLVLLPPFTAAIQSFLGTKSPTGLATGAFNLIISDPPACTVGFLPPSQWRSPADTRTVDTPDGLYCKLPQDSPIGVRGARNYPCMGQPGKRAPTVEICESDKPFEPLAMRQHVFGTYPLDPNLIAQGIPPDDRVNWNRERIFGPVEGTPLPPGAVPRGTPPSALPPPAAPISPPAPMGEVSPIAPIDVPARRLAGPRPPARQARRRAVGGAKCVRSTTSLSPARRWRSPSTTRTPVATSPRMARFTASRIWSRPRRPRRQDVEGHVRHVKPRRPSLRQGLSAFGPGAPGHLILSSLNGCSIYSGLLVPQAPLGPVVCSRPARTGDPSMFSPVSGFAG